MASWHELTMNWRALDATTRYEYEVGQRVEHREYGAWLPVTIEGRFIGPSSGEPVYIIAGSSDRDRYHYGCDLRPLPESRRT